jgi:hypothetical protein
MGRKPLHVFFMVVKRDVGSVIKRLGWWGGGGEGLNRFVPPNGGTIREGPYQGEGLFEKTVKLTVSSSKIWQ